MFRERQRRSVGRAAASRQVWHELTQRRRRSTGASGRFFQRERGAREPREPALERWDTRGKCAVSCSYRRPRPVLLAHEQATYAHRCIVALTDAAATRVARALCSCSQGMVQVFWVGFFVFSSKTSETRREWHLRKQHHNKIHQPRPGCQSQAAAARYRCARRRAASIVCARRKSAKSWPTARGGCAVYRDPSARLCRWGSSGSPWGSI